MAEESGSLSSLGQLIPSVFYDLIARVCPGVAFLVALFWHKRHAIEHLVHNAWVGFFLLLGAGYIAGLLLTTLSLLWTVLIGLPIQCAFNIRINEWSRNDEIAEVNPEAGTTLAKMQAEATLAQNLLTGFVVLWIAVEKGALCLGPIKHYPWAIFPVLGGSVVFRTAVYLGRQQKLYEMYFPERTPRRSLVRLLQLMSLRIARLLRNGG